MNLTDHVMQSIEKASRLESKLDPEILTLLGMSSAKTRHFFNNIGSIPGLRYFEIGMWRGSTLSSVVSNNPGITFALGCDNWSQQYWSDIEEGMPPRKDTCISNVHKFAPFGLNFRIIDQDCFTLDPTSLGSKFNVYFYDGAHDYLSQLEALTHFYECLDDEFIWIVDDYNPFNGKEVMLATQDAILEVGATKIFEQHLPAHKNMDTENWWNGLYVCVLRKRQP